MNKDLEKLQEALDIILVEHDKDYDDVLKNMTISALLTKAKNPELGEKGKEAYKQIERGIDALIEITGSKNLNWVGDAMRKSAHLPSPLEGKKPPVEMNLTRKKPKGLFHINPLK